jgi:predicted DCC family thiol-disulfide oxidoreductase YuxK
MNRAAAELGGFWPTLARLYDTAPIRRLEDATYSWFARHRQRFGWLRRLLR